MNKQILKEVIYGGVNEIIQNPRLYYDGYGDERFSKFTEDGQRAMLEFMKTMAYKMSQANGIELNQKAKQLVVNNLKGDNTTP